MSLYVPVKAQKVSFSSWSVLTVHCLTSAAHRIQIYRGADVYKKDINDTTALMWSACEGHSGVALLLLKAGERQMSTGHSPNSASLHIAAKIIVIIIIIYIYIYIYIFTVARSESIVDYTTW